MDTLLANHGLFQRACVPIGCSTLHFFATGDVAASWLAVETSDVPYILKLASGNLTSWAAGDTVSLLESSWDGPGYTAATSPATVWSRREYLVQTGLKRERDDKPNKTRAGAKTGRGGDSRVASLGVSWYNYLDFQTLLTSALNESYCF